LKFKARHTNSSREPVSKKLIQKRAGGVAQRVAPEFKPQYHKKERKKENSDTCYNMDELGGTLC
jgi:hypothetical protein